MTIINRAHWCVSASSEDDARRSVEDMIRKEYPKAEINLSVLAIETDADSDGKSDG